VLGRGQVQAPNHGQLPLTGLRGDRCNMLDRDVNEFCHGGVRLVSQLPGEPIEARMSPVHIFVVIVRRLVLILKTFIMFHTVGWAGHGAPAMGCSP
jgi:hypothetical protein